MVIKPISFTTPQIDPRQLQQFIPAASLGEIPIWGLPEFQGFAEPQRRAESWKGLLESATSGAPAYGGIGEGLARLAAAALGGFKSGQAEREIDKRKKADREAFAEWLKGPGAKTDLSGLALASASDDPAISGFASRLAGDVPTELEREREQLERDKFNLAQEAQLEEVSEGVRRSEQASREFTQRERERIGRFNLAIEEMDPANIEARAEAEARATSKYAIPGVTTDAFGGAWGRYPGRIEQLSEGFLPGFNQPTVEDTTDQKGQQGLSEPNLFYGSGLGTAVSRGINTVTGFFSDKSGSPELTKVTDAVNSFNNEMRQLVTEINEGRPSNYQIQLIDNELPETPDLVNSIDQSMGRLYGLKNKVQRFITSNRQFRPVGVAATNRYQEDEIKLVRLLGLVDRAIAGTTRANNYTPGGVGATQQKPGGIGSIQGFGQGMGSINTEDDAVSRWGGR